MSLAPLVTLLSLEMTNRLVTAGAIAATLTLVGASNTTPIVVETQADHGFASGQRVHAVISGVAGNTAANGTWICTPTDATHFSLSTLAADGTPVTSVGSGSYVNGGSLSFAFPDGAILLGRRNVAMMMSMATPRIVFVPVGSPAWTFDAYAGTAHAHGLPPALSDWTLDQKNEALKPQLATEPSRFEVHVTGAANPPDPDYGDFEATQALYHALWGVLFDLVTPPRARILEGRWISQDAQQVAQLDVRGQKWVGILEILQPVVANPYTFVPDGTVGEIDVTPYGGASADTIVIEMQPVTP